MRRHLSLPIPFQLLLPLIMLFNSLLWAFFAVSVAAKHRDCTWDPLQGRQPSDMGYIKFCESSPINGGPGEPPQKYLCANNHIVAGFGTKPGELEFGEQRQCARSPNAIETDFPDVQRSRATAMPRF